MRFNFNFLIAVATILTIILPSTAKKQQSTSNRQLSDYLMLEATTRISIDSIAQPSLMIMRQAYLADTTNTAAAFNYGVSLLNNKNNIVIGNETDRILHLLEGYVNEHPDKYFENLLYAEVCSNCNNIDKSLETLNRLKAIYPDKSELRSAKATILFNNSDYTHAIEILDSIEAISGLSEQDNSLKMKCYLNICQDFFEAKDTLAFYNTLNSVIKKNPSNKENYYMAGVICNFVAQNDSALAYFDRALALDSLNATSLILKAQIMNEMGNEEEYEDIWKKLILNRDVSIEDKETYLRYYLNSYVESKDSAGYGEKMLEAVVKQHPYEAGFRKLYSDYLDYFKYDTRNAIEQLQYAIDIEPNDQDSWLKLIRLQSTIQPEEALQTAKRAESIITDSTRLNYAKALVYYSMEDYQQCIDYYLKVLDNNNMDDNANALMYSTVANCYGIIGDTIECLKYYKWSVDMAPDNAMCLNNYAYYLCINFPDRLDEAEKLSEKAITISPDNYSYLDTYAWIMFLRHNYDKALIYIEDAYKQSIDSEALLTYELYEHYGDILFMLQRPKEALDMWKKAYKINPDSALLKKKIENETYFYE